MNTMEKDKQVMMAIVTAAMVVGLMSVSTSSRAVADTQTMEKCYGIVKSGMNDCDENDISCSMKAVIDSDPNYWIYLPKGACAKIVGGITKSVAGMGASPDMGAGTGMGASTTSTTTSTESSKGINSTSNAPSTTSPGTSTTTEVSIKPAAKLNIKSR